MIPVGHERDKAIAEQLGLEYWERPPFGVTVLGVPPTHLGHVSTDPIAAFRLLEWGVEQNKWRYRTNRWRGIGGLSLAWVEIRPHDGNPDSGVYADSEDGIANAATKAILKAVSP